MPVFVLTGEKASGEFLIEQARLVATNVVGKVIMRSGHWLMEEAPQTVIPALVAFIDQPVDSHPAGAAALQHATILVNGVKLHYVIAGEGEPVVLVPGWPESWFTWRRVIPKLVQKTAGACTPSTPRGFGDSDKPVGRYDPGTAANDLHALIAALNLAKDGGVDIVGHDIGTWITFAHATTYPQDVRRLVLSEASIPGVSTLPGGTPDRATNLRIWHFGFNRLNDLPEILVKGHERAYLAWFFNNKTLHKGAIDDALDEYARLFSNPDNVRASFDYYRDSFDETGLAQGKAEAARRLTMPVLALGGEGGVGEAMLKTLQPLSDNVHGGVLTGCGHYLPEECPDELTQAILEFWKTNPSPGKTR